MEGVDKMSEENLHPVMSMLYAPWDRPVFDEQRDENGPIRSLWRKKAPSQEDENESSTRKEKARTAEQIRQEKLDDSQYRVKREIPWLPDIISIKEAAWKMALYTTLGATPDDIADRIAIDDPGLGDKVICHIQLRNALNKRITDWLMGYGHGGFQWLKDRQRKRSRKGEGDEGKEEKHDFAAAVLTGMKWKNGEVKRTAVSDLGYFFVRCLSISFTLTLIRHRTRLGW
jgi:hypothetical protein